MAHGAASGVGSKMLHVLFVQLATTLSQQASEGNAQDLSVSKRAFWRFAFRVLRFSNRFYVVFFYVVFSS